MTESNQAYEELKACILRDLREYVKMWSAPLSYKYFLPKHNRAVTQAGKTLKQLENELISEGLVKVYLSPSSARFYMPADHDMSIEDIMTALSSIEHANALNKKGRSHA